MSEKQEVNPTASTKLTEWNNLVVKLEPLCNKPPSAQVAVLSETPKYK